MMHPTRIDYMNNITGTL